MGSAEDEEGMSDMSSTLIVQPGSGLEPVLAAIRRARRRIDVAIFRLTAESVEQELGAAVGRGVEVRALVAHKAKGETDVLREVEQRLLARGVTVSRSAEDLLKYHGKYLLVDDTLHLLGFNFKKHLKTRSFGIRTRHRRAVEEAERLFEADWCRQAYHPRRGSPLVVSPETSRGCLERFIAGAKSELAIYDVDLSDKDFGALIVARAAAGVTVRVIGKAPALDGAVAVRALKGPKLHVRAMIRDGSHVFVGSQSLRGLELDRRREVGLTIVNRAVARQMMSVFEFDWEQSATRKVEQKEADLDYAPVA
jgi:phosphatidylserine/phosphatidylglycerophosphate/cardiolipin synthase-like enzyme